MNNYNYIPKNLLTNIKFHSGRNKGNITVRHRGGGIKYLYTNINFKYCYYTTTLALILKFYIDFSRTSIIILVLFLNGYLKGTKQLLLSTNSMKLGDLLSFTSQFPIKLGSVRQIAHLHIGINIHSLTYRSFNKISVARSLGTRAKIIYHTTTHTCIKLPSGQFKLFNNNCKAVVGQNFILNRVKKKIKAGDKKFKNFRPTVRGVAMNAYDHPHGGGCGRTSIGLRSSKTPWGKIHYGVKTKSNTTLSKFILNYIV